MNNQSSKETAKTRVAVLFGGRSTEHEISIITGLQVLDAFDATRFETIPVYIDPEGYWYVGDALRHRDNYLLSPKIKEQLCRVELNSNPLSELVEVDPPKGLFSRKKPERYPVDVFFPAFHGTYGEDGCIQGLLEFIDVAYVGSGPRAAAIAMNKYTAKRYLSTLGIPVLPDVLLDRRNWEPAKAEVTANEVVHELSLPVMVKPCNLGSSIGISAAHDLDQLMISLAGSFVFDSQIIVEPLLENMYELNISVMDNDPLRLSAAERPKRDQEFLTFDQKYMQGNKKTSSQSEGMASLQRDINPKDIPDKILDQVKNYAKRGFAGLDCRGLARFDFLVDQGSGQVFFNEINTLPGSFAYYLWEQAEPPLSFTELLTELVRLAQVDLEHKRNLRRKLERQIFKD